MSDPTPASTNYTPLQEELLRLYALNLDEKHLVQIKELIDEYLSENVFDQPEEGGERKEITPEEFDRWAKQNL